MTTSFRRTALFLLFGLTSLAVQAAEKRVTIGYISNSEFFPLLAVEDGKLAGRPQNIPLEGEVINAFVSTDERYRVISTSPSIVDEISGETYEYGTLKETAHPKPEYLYALASGTLPSEPAAGQEAIVRSFYEFFSHDKWGKHFFTTSPGVLSKSVEAIGKTIKVAPLYVTDLDKNGQRELWMTAELMYGETEYVVYEQIPGEPKWRLVSTLCPGCD
jgi:hypothetical protein